MQIWYVYFVEDTKTPLLVQAYNALDGMENANLSWIKTEDILQTSTFNKHCSYIFGYFEEKSIYYLKSNKILAFGPQCLLDYLRNDETLPICEIPLFSTALKNVEVCFTGFNEEVKKELSDKVVMMHGTVSKDLNASAKILISPSIGTRKYRAASEIGIPVVSKDWINKIWELTQNTDPLDGADEYWIEQYRIPIFHNLQISLTGFPILEREIIEKIIIKCGGFYNPDLTVGICTHLIAMQASGEKFECAKKWKIITVNYQWLLDSVRKGYACDEKKYQLSGRAYIPGLSQTDSSSNNSAGQNDKIICDNKLNTKIWKDCVIQFLDCEPEFVEKWSNLITEFGGEACKNLNDLSVVFVTHIIVGDVSKLKEKEDDITYVNGDWLQACLDGKALSDSKQFAIEIPKSPIAVPISNPIPDLSINWDLMDQYNLGNVSNPFDSNSERINNENINPNSFGIFHKYRFFLHNLSRVQIKAVSDLIINNSGIINCSPDGASYIVLSDSLCRSPPQECSSLVTVFYLTECVKHKQLLSIESDFMFTRMDINPNILTGTILSFSGYSVDERSLLKSICSAAGATVQDQMSRKPLPDKNIFATTHLIISKPDKKKFPSSKIWNIPAVTKHWIGDCIAHREMLSTDLYSLELLANSVDKGKTEINHGVRKRKASEEIDTRPISKRKICEGAELIENKSEKIFVLCTIDKASYVTLREAVKKLGGAMELGADYNGEFTHLVSGRPGRTEKYLAAIAAGKWVLHTSYIDDSMAAGRWMEEYQYQWGGLRTSEFIELESVACRFTKFDLALADAAKRFHDNGGGSFQDWRVCLVEEREKFEKMSRIIESGGGTIVPLIEPVKELHVTHFLINKNLCSGLPDLTSHSCYEIDLIPFYLSARNDCERKKFMKKFTIPVTEMDKLFGKITERSRCARKSKIF